MSLLLKIVAFTKSVLVFNVVVPTFVPAGNERSSTLIVAFTTLNVVLYSPTISVSFAFVALIVTLPVPTAVFPLVTIVVLFVALSVVAFGITSSYGTVFFVALSTKVKSAFVTSSPTFFEATVMSYFSPNLLKSSALTV